MAWLRATAILVSAALVTTITPSELAAKGAARAIAFPDGTWSGTAFISGRMSKEATTITGRGTIVFGLIVQRGRADGQLKYDVRQEGHIETSGVSGDVHYTGVLEAVGSAGKVFADGTIDYVGIFYGGISGGSLSGSMDAEISFSPRGATCTRVWGDLAVDVRETQRAAGFSTSVKAPFVAISVPSKGATPPADITEGYTEMYDALKNALEYPKTTLELAKLVVLAERLHSKIMGYAVCRPLTSEETGSLAYNEFRELLTRILRKLLGRAAELDTGDLILLLTTAIRIGAIGPAAPKSVNDEFLSEFERLLRADLDQAAADGDRATILMIAVAAEQAGMATLARDAKAKL